MPDADIPAGVAVSDLGGGILAPGFVDVQVNGGGGVLLNDDPTPGGVRAIAAAHRRFGTTGMLPTVITDAPEVMRAAADAVARARREGAPGVLGIHIEGPFIDIRRKGAHPPERIRPLGEEDLAWLAGLDCGVVLLTVSPSDVPPETIRRLVEAGISSASAIPRRRYAQALAALAAGAQRLHPSLQRHEPARPPQPRHGGRGAVLAHAYAGLIADGFHVDDTALKVALAAKPHDRLVLVTDAMPPAAGGPDVVRPAGPRGDARATASCVLADGTLAGSTLTMDEAVRYGCSGSAWPLADALRMASRNPARSWIGLGAWARPASRRVPGRPGASRATISPSTPTWVEGS